MTTFEFLADALMLAHAAFSLFVVSGLVLILVGLVFNLRWTRTRWFRMPHLLATLFLVVRVWIGLRCPFSAAEDRLRHEATAPCPLGAAFHRILHQLAFRGEDPHRFAMGTTLFGAVVIAAHLWNVRCYSNDQNQLVMRKNAPPQICAPGG